MFINKIKMQQRELSETLNYYFPILVTQLNQNLLTLQNANCKNVCDTFNAYFLVMLDL